MTKTKIEWADRVWNPVTGCEKVSAGCAHCYAETMAKRFWKDRKFSDVRHHPDRLFQPLSWKKPARVFVNSMSDLFHKDVPFTVVLNIWRVMIDAKQHTFMILTKRPERMVEFIKWLNMSDDEIAKNIWLGVSIEDQKSADLRIPLLLQTPATVRFVSCEPLLGNLDISPYVWIEDVRDYGIERDALDWVIVGGESGPNARPMHPEWARSIRDQCVDAGVPFFFKQWGEWVPSKQKYVNEYKYYSWGDGNQSDRVGKKQAGRLLDGREWNEFPMSE
jgi:protein gp37